MTTFRERATDAADNSEGRLTLAEILEIFSAGRLPLKFTAYDGSTAGPEDAVLGLDLRTPAAPPTWPLLPETWDLPGRTSRATSSRTGAPGRSL